MRQRLAFAVAVACGVIAAAPARAEAPPYVTTDTDIADKLELATFVSLAAHDGGHFSTLGFDLAVPLAPAWELTLVPRFAEAHHDDQGAIGFGDTEVAVKYLALSETDSRPAVAFEPNITFPTGGRRLGEGRVAIEIPLLVSKGVGPWRVSGQVGFERVGFKTPEDHAPVSLLVERTMTEHLSLGAELANDLPMRRPSQGSTEVNFGAAWTFHDGLKLQSAFGRRLATQDTPADLHSTIALAVEF
jgi:Putative MetA-pathway of phenol degradation